MSDPEEFSFHLPLAMSGYGQTAVAIAICLLAVAGFAVAKGNHTFALKTLVFLGLLAMTIYGFLGVAVSGLCDTSCPSSTETLFFRFLLFAGLIGLAALGLRALPSRPAKK